MDRQMARENPRFATPISRPVRSDAPTNFRALIIGKPDLYFNWYGIRIRADLCCAKLKLNEESLHDIKVQSTSVV